MQVHARPEHEASILVPEPSDTPAELEDAIHDEVVRVREEERRCLSQVILDLSQVQAQGPWLKAAGPQIPDTNLRVVLGAQGYLAARALRLDAVYEWYPDVESALNASV